MLDISFIIEINSKLGGSVLNENSLLSIFSSVEYYETPQEKIACVVRGLIKNHPFTDANKRTANVVFFALCESNNIKIEKTSKEMFDLTIDIATHNYSIKEVEQIIFGK